MNQDDLRTALQALVNDASARSKIARLRELLPAIEDAKRAGVRHQAIVDALNQHGLAPSLKSFEMMLYRLRR
ncbi:hypothetical protein EFP18_11110 [Burkholderia glumae]|uniref:hypothetical protein n=1 Tax=Burkholderia glumae TaxID=337 RepID=UPI00036D9A2F|nr:hypothetical protein [Burkholderia glumae]MCM2493783.1 hypothetical protein [Burkholderia glumae]MCM2546977.1 hypothetical protein [Burkholderia glumae]MCQ0034541.1 hypothetical protein [Burkholderia glumae]MCQ0040047.1 hypothetical protein [Burkholderia glumae]PJO20126.1 hypothetical protein Y5A_026620 [Burkholderia glumae AU6208]